MSLVENDRERIVKLEVQMQGIISAVRALWGLFAGVITGLAIWLITHRI